MTVAWMEVDLLLILTVFLGNKVPFIVSLSVSNIDKLIGKLTYFGITTPPHTIASS